MVSFFAFKSVSVCKSMAGERLVVAQGREEVEVRSTEENMVIKKNKGQNLLGEGTVHVLIVVVNV